MRRRDFLKLLTVSTTGAVLFTGCKLGGYPDREFQKQSPVEHPADIPFGRDNWYATAMPAIGGGLGVIVRVFEGRAKKIEGNPDFPLNVGKTGPRAQAIVQELYHPDRIDGPMRRNGNSFESISWSDATAEVAQLVSNASSPVLVTEPISGAIARVAGEFAEQAGARHAVYEPDEYVVLRAAMQRVFGTDRFPALDLPNSGAIVSFGADFLHNWISPVMFSVGYGEFRQGGNGTRGSYYHVGPRLSDSAASADRWYPCSPGSEGHIALAVAYTLVEEGMASEERASEVYGGLSLGDYSPEDVAADTGLSAEQIREIARELGRNAPSVAIAGGSAAAHTNGLFNLCAVFALNYLTESVNTEGGILTNTGSPDPDVIPNKIGGNSFAEWDELIEEMLAGDVDLLMVHKANPVFGMPAASRFQDALDQVSTVVSFSSFMDETTRHADLILPDNTTLEQWGLDVPDPSPGFQLVSIQQPVVEPFVSSRNFGDSLIRISNDAGLSFTWSSMENAVRELGGALGGVGRGLPEEASDPREFFVAMQTQGGWWDEESMTSDAPSGPEDMPSPAEPQFTGDESEYDFYLLPFPTNSYEYGETANLPWLQGLPDPITTAVWTTWVELNPNTADDMGVQLGDIVRIESPNGSIEVPVYVNPAAPPTVAAVPIGQGHTEYTHYAEDRGANPIEIVASQTDSETGALAWAATRVRIEPLNRRERFPRFERQLPFQLEENPIVQVTRDA
ncbi:MAG: 4Fe-4S ferredoxin [Sphaerobacteraceae bacterium]|nr:MAG: 4Fe-4S ferredoxin [Sphaerobacteraceae bacterium]